MKRVVFVFLSFLTVISLYGESNLKLWYKAPADIWLEALPIGNSIMGAMVFGGVYNERIQFNEETFWGGGPHKNDSDKALENLENVRDLIFSEKYKEAQDLVGKTFFTGKNGMPYHTIGSLLIENIDKTEYTDYRRELDLSKAVVTSEYVSNGVKYVRETFASLSDSAIVMRFSSDKDGMLSFRLKYESLINNHKILVRDNKLILKCKGYDHEGVKGVLDVETQVALKNEGGNIYYDKDYITVKNANSVTVYIASATNFLRYDNVNGNAHLKSSDRLSAAMKYGYTELKERHIKKYGEQFSRVELNLPVGGNSKLQTVDRILKFGEGKDEDLIALMFQYGRYLLISSSQPGGQPANLQGVWNNDIIAPWDGKYTININLQMNYWIAEATNLSETHQPLLNMVKELSETGRTTAKKMYGARGWMTHHNTDLWRSTGMVDGAYWGAWPHGGGWLLTHLWMHYLYTGDIDFLRKSYPIFKGASQFYVDYLTKHPKYGWMISAPSISPEHGPNEKNGVRNPSVTAGATMDNQIAFDVLNQTLAVAKILGNIDKEFQDTLLNMIENLPPMQIGKYNQLQEWIQDLDDPEDKHRHLSHLYGIFPSNQISPYREPLLFQAVKQSMEYRGDDATGWSIAWKLNIWARLQDGNRARNIIKNMIRLRIDNSEDITFRYGRTYSNLFNACPPFQIDGNFGFASGVTEMLLQSHDGAVHLLPAIPDSWEYGEVKGLKTRGGFEVAIKWKNRQVQEAVIESELGGNLRIRSYVPLSGKDLKEAKGENPNHYFKRPETKSPVLSEGATFVYPKLLKVYEYDIQTEKNKKYYVYVKK